MKHALTICLILLTAHAAGAEDILANGGFEGRFGPNGIADGWNDNSGWADLDVEYSRGTRNPHSGVACQRVTCTRLGQAGGAVQMISAGYVPLQRGRIYRVRAWMRGDAGLVQVMLRQLHKPWKIYAEESLMLSPAWKEIEYLSTCTVDDPESLFMVRFSRVGSVWVDDVSVESFTFEELARTSPPPEPGNLLHNGSFDLGAANWLLNRNADYVLDPVLSVEETAGGPCLKLVVPKDIGTRQCSYSPVVLCSDVVEVTPGRPVRISCRVRADAPATIRFFSRYAGNRWKDVKIGGTWKVLEASGSVGFGVDTVDYVRFQVFPHTVLWLDDVQLRQDGETGPDKHRRAAILCDRHPLGLYHDGDKPVLRLFSSVPAGVLPVELRWRVGDFQGEVRLSGGWKPKQGRQRKRIACGRLTRGWYRATVSWTDKGRKRRNECTFCILPPAERHGEAFDSPFGAHFALDPTSLKLARAVGVRWLRLHPPVFTKWRVVQPQEGKWVWHDEMLRAARDAGMEVFGSLDRCPAWASSAPPVTGYDSFWVGTGSWVPRNWDEWEDYVAQTVRHYKKDIHIWEVWNEPNLPGWLKWKGKQTRAQALVEILRHTYPVVKREDPAATVVGGCPAGALHDKSGAWKLARELIAEGGLEFMDVFSFHDYIEQPVDEGADPLETWVARLRATMRGAGREIPVINSEGGFKNPGTSLTYRPCRTKSVPPDKMASWLVRQYVSQLAAGINRFFYYNFFINGLPVKDQWDSFVEGDGQPQPNVAAYAVMTWLLDGASFERTERPGKDIWAHYFSTPRGPLVVIWSRSGTTGRMRLRRAEQAWDLVGGSVNIPPHKKFTITDAPIYIRLKK